MYAACLIHCVLLVWSLLILVKRSSSLCIFHHFPVTSSPIGSNTILCIRFWKPSVLPSSNLENILNRNELAPQSRVLEKPTVAQLLRKVLALFWTWRFILCSQEPISVSYLQHNGSSQSLPPYFFKGHFYFMLPSTPSLPSGLFSQIYIIQSVPHTRKLCTARPTGDILGRGTREVVSRTTTKIPALFCGLKTSVQVVKETER
jgi:hypothetical protein